MTIRSNFQQWSEVRYWWKVGQTLWAWKSLWKCWNFPKGEFEALNIKINVFQWRFSSEKVEEKKNKKCNNLLRWFNLDKNNWWWMNSIVEEYNGWEAQQKLLRSKTMRVDFIECLPSATILEFFFYEPISLSTIYYDNENCTKIVFIVIFSSGLLCISYWTKEFCFISDCRKLFQVIIFTFQFSRSQIEN